MHKIKIKLDGINAKFFIDGKEIKGVSAYSVCGDTKSVHTVRLEIIPKSIEIEGEAAVGAKLAKQ
jgi:hypothetical protein